MTHKWPVPLRLFCLYQHICGTVVAGKVDLVKVPVDLVKGGLSITLMASVLFP